MTPRNNSWIKSFICLICSYHCPCIKLWLITRTCVPQWSPRGYHRVQFQVHCYSLSRLLLLHWSFVVSWLMLKTKYTTVFYYYDIPTQGTAVDNVIWTRYSKYLESTTFCVIDFDSKFDILRWHEAEIARDFFKVQSFSALFHNLLENGGSM